MTDEPKTLLDMLGKNKPGRSVLNNHDLDNDAPTAEMLEHLATKRWLVENMDTDVPEPEGKAGDIDAKAAVRRRDRWEETVERGLNRFWERRKKILLARVRTTQFRQGTVLWDPPGTEPLANRLHILIDRAEWDRELTEEMTPILTDLYAEAQKGFVITTVEGKAEVPPEEPEPFQPPQLPSTPQAPTPSATPLQQFIARWIGFTLRLNEEAADAVREVLAAEPQTNDEMRAAIEEHVDRTQRVTRSVTAIAIATGGVNQAQQEAAQTSTVVLDKIWYSAQDNRVRPAHRLVNGQRKGIDDPFEVPGRDGRSHPMAYPGDISAPAHLWINCRCVSLFSTSLSPQVWDNDTVFDPFGRRTIPTKGFTPEQLGLYE